MTADNRKKYSIGIDLGTTNSVVAYCRLDEEEPRVHLLDIAQLVAPATVEPLPALPSFVYLALQHEAADGSLNLPWREGSDFAVGRMARERSAEMPDRSVASAKSWLCHSRVDRRQPILPWNAPEGVEKISPVEATRRYLEHLAAAWEQAFPDAPIAEQSIVLTVPASFDAGARDLTREAALAAGLPEDLVLLEEPQAAVYAWLDAMGTRWRKTLRADDILLVCDVGGGTTDLTLIGVTEEQGELALRRIAVGNHLLIGGDNMDLALAHYVAGLFGQKGTKLDAWQSVSLWHACRAAKEALLGADGPESHPVSVLGRGSRLIGGTVSVDVPADEAQKLLLDGFFPVCRADEMPSRRRASGFQEIGLPYESDPAVTRHLAAFLQAHGQDDQSVRPNHLLFNGGVFKSEAFRTRLIETLGGWFDGQGPRPLDSGVDLDAAVARGAASYGWSKQHGGVRIRGGTARSYYVGIETSGLAIPGMPRPLRALCTAPFGMEEGTETDVPSEEFGLVVGQPAVFRFFSSAVRKQDRPGDLIDAWDEGELVETDPMELTLPADPSIDQPYVPVRFHTKIDELGTFQQWCFGTKSQGRWKLEFSVREEAEQE